MPSLLPLTLASSFSLPTPPYTPKSSRDDSENLNAMQCFLLQRSQTEKVAAAIGRELTKTTPQGVTFSSSCRIMEETIKEEPTPDFESTAEDISDIQDSVSDIQFEN